MVRKNSLPSYFIALAMQLVFFYFGFQYLLNTDIPPVYRLIATCVFFPLAAAASIWGGHIALQRKGEKYYALLQLVETLPVRLFLGIVLGGIIVAVLALSGMI